MSYDLSHELNTNKFFIVQRSELEERLDPFFYKPHFRNYSQIRNLQFKKLNELTNSIQHPPEYERIYSSEGYQLLRAQNVRPTGIELDNNRVFFDEEFLKGKSLVFPEIGDVLVVRSGVNAGDTAVVEEKYKKVIIGADNLLLKVNDKIVAKFLQVFFYTSIGKNLMRRYLTGATNKHINPYNLGKIPIPFVKKSIQKKAIDVFENALLYKKQNEVEAERLLSSIDDYLLKELGIELPEQPVNTLNNRIFKTEFSHISGIRFDAFYFQEMFKENIRAIKSGKYSTKYLSEIITDKLIKGTLPKQDEKDGINKVVQINCINKDGTILLEDVLTSKDIFISEQKLNLGDVLIVITGATIGKIAYWDYSGEYFLGGDIVKFQTNSFAISTYVFNFLRSKLCQVEIKRNITGATNGHLSPYVIKHLNIPIPPIEKQKEITDHITQIRQQAQQLKDKTKEALTRANQEIEEILLG